MKAIDCPFTKINNGTTQFVIPVFQRDYSWTETQCERLWKDVLLIANDPTSRGHCMGSVVYVSTGDTSAGFTRWLLIDGQRSASRANHRHRRQLHLHVPMGHHQRAPHIHPLRPQSARTEL
jgi:hypothetical protein